MALNNNVDQSFLILDSQPTFRIRHPGTHFKNQSQGDFNTDDTPTDAAPFSEQHRRTGGPAEPELA